MTTRSTGFRCPSAISAQACARRPSTPVFAPASCATYRGVEGTTSTQPGARVQRWAGAGLQVLDVTWFVELRAVPVPHTRRALAPPPAPFIEGAGRPAFFGVQ